jgi:hypothetical protein
VHAYLCMFGHTERDNIEHYFPSTLFFPRRCCAVVKKLFGLLFCFFAVICEARGHHTNVVHTSSLAFFLLANAHGKSIDARFCMRGSLVSRGLLGSAQVF